MFAAVVLAGGAARRMGGRAKPAIAVGGRSMLARVIAAVAAASPRVVVGPAELRSVTDVLPPGSAEVTVVREDPPGGGPVAALAAGLALLHPPPWLAPVHPRHRADPRADPRADGSDDGHRDRVAVLAADLPFLTVAVVDRLRAAAVGSDAAVLVDDEGRPQWLCGVWRLDVLTERLTALGPLAGRGMRELADGVAVRRVVAPGDGPPAWFDCDTDEDVRRAEVWAGGDAG